MHCFSGNMKLIQRIIKNGWFLSIPTAVKHATHFQEVIKLAPLNQLLCETDAPYLHPDKERDNESKNIIVSYEKIAEIKKLPLKEVEKQIEDNYRRLFGI
jgi:TatD DNase family protein